MTLIFFLSILNLISFSLSEERNCIAGSARVEFVDGEYRDFEARAVNRQCPSEHFNCAGIRKFGASRRKDAPTNDNTTLRHWSSLDMGCAHPLTCKRALNGETTGCNYALYSFNRYEPTSCDAGNDYDAVEYRQFVKLFYGCCAEDYCVNPQSANYDSLWETCEENEDLSAYLTDLHQCWNGVKFAWRRYFVCGNGTSVFNYRKNCSDSTYDQWDSSSNCTVTRTCSRKLRMLVKAFGQCACTAAKENHFSGELITKFMETLWNRFCGDIDLRCDGPDRSLWLRRKRRKYRLKIRLARSDLTDEEKRAIRRKIAARWRCQEEDVEEVTDETVTRRRLATSDYDIDLITDGDDLYLEWLQSENLCDSTEMSTVLGETVTIEGCDQIDDYEEIYGSNSTVFTTTMATTEADFDTTMPVSQDGNSSVSKLFIFIAIGISFIGIVFV